MVPQFRHRQPEMSDQAQRAAISFTRSMARRMTSTSRSKASAQTLQFRASPRHCSSRAPSGSWDEILDQGRYVGQPGYIIRPASAERGARHFGKCCILGILHDRDAAAVLQSLQAGGAVAERTGQHDPDRTMAIAEGD